MLVAVPPRPATWPRRSYDTNRRQVRSQGNLIWVPYVDHYAGSVATLGKDTAHARFLEGPWPNGYYAARGWEHRASRMSVALRWLHDRRSATTAHADIIL